MRSVLIVGATSAIAEATARRYAARGAALYLLGRDERRLAEIADDLNVRGAASVVTAVLDVDRHDEHAQALARAQRTLGEIDLALIAHGTLPRQSELDTSAERTVQAFVTNGLSTIALMTTLAEQLERQGRGCLAVISSIAGDRGRASNAAYGAAKAAVSAYASALRQRAARRGVHVLTIKPGFVDTPMTAELPKGLLWATPDAIAAGIVRAVDAGRAVVYLPWFWRPIMFVVRILPEFVFKRLRF